jgi:hypothetical protein
MVAVEGQVTFGEVLSFLDAARSVDNLDFVLLTPNSVPVRQQPSLFMKGEAINTQYFFPFVSSPGEMKEARRNRCRTLASSHLCSCWPK